MTVTFRSSKIVWSKILFNELGQDKTDLLSQLGPVHYLIDLISPVFVIPLEIMSAGLSFERQRCHVKNFVKSCIYVNRFATNVCHLGLMEIWNGNLVHSFLLGRRCLFRKKGFEKLIRVRDMTPNTHVYLLDFPEIVWKPPNRLKLNLIHSSIL